MKMILIGGPKNQEVIEILYPSNKIILHDGSSEGPNQENRIVYERTPAVIDGYPVYKYIAPPQ